ncbi:MAG: hypothetical protein JWM33_992 [Caulobacteraceae bacterium]|nr:hypothetical protein [Caulobacteraceae bacterium]
MIARAVHRAALWAALALAAAVPSDCALAAAAPAGRAVDGHFGSDWIACTQVGDQLPTGGFVLHCASLPDDNVFSASDVRPAAAARPAGPTPPAIGGQTPAVQGLIRGRWEDCTLVGAPATGGSLLHCPSLPEDAVFSASEVRLTPGPAAIRPAAPATGATATQPVQGLVRGIWQDCLMIGPPLPTGGRLLRCPYLLEDSVFSASEVRAAPGAPVAPLAAAPAPAGRPVQGLIRGVWENCTQIGDQLPTGGYRLRCASLPDESVFAASDVRG